MANTVLINELSGDPLGRGYSAMTDQEAADDLNTEYRSRQVDRIDPASVLINIDESEFSALNNAGKAEVWNLVQVGGELWVRAGDIARTRLVSLFGGGSATIAALTAEATTSISRAQELGLGRVKPGHIEGARS